MSLVFDTPLIEYDSTPSLAEVGVKVMDPTLVTVTAAGLKGCVPNHGPPVCIRSPVQRVGPLGCNTAAYHTGVLLVL